jgi:CRISPR-associated protein Cas2
MYDISDDGRLRRVHDAVRSRGTRFQYSVFLCDLSPTELIDLRWEVGEFIDHSADSVAIIDLGPTDSVSRETFSFLGIRPSLPTGGSTVL